MVEVEPEQRGSDVIVDLFCDPGPFFDFEPFGDIAAFLGVARGPRQW